MKRGPPIAVLWLSGLSLDGCRKAEALPGFALGPVVAPRIAALEAEIGVLPPAAAPDAATVERIRGLVAGYPGAQARMKKAFTDEARDIGDAALPVLAGVIGDARAPDAQRVAAIELAAAIDSARAAELLVERAEAAVEPWVRANAAFQLAHTTQDQILPRLLLRLKYETDGDSVVWIATTLAHFGNWAGLDGLRVLAAGAETEEVRGTAAERIAALAREAGVGDGESLFLLWNDGDAEEKLERKPPSARHRLEVWRTIARLSEQNLRPVDDARFVLARCAWWVAEPLAEALHEETVYTRSHAAQCLERMGPRAAAAAPEIALALREPRLAPSAATALGAIGWKPGAEPLVAALDPRADPDLRNAAARALGMLGEPTAIEPLRRILASPEPIDLRQAAARSLLLLGRGDEAAPLLLECLTSDGADAPAAEVDLETWLAGRAAAGEADAASALECWMALAPPEGVTPTAAEAVARRLARSRCVDVRVEPGGQVRVDRR